METIRILRAVRLSVSRLEMLVFCNQNTVKQNKDFCCLFGSKSLCGNIWPIMQILTKERFYLYLISERVLNTNYSGITEVRLTVWQDFYGE